VATLRHCLVTVARLLAPAAPFTSDWIHRAITGESVHLAEFPRAGAREQDLTTATEMEAVRRLASAGRAARESMGIRVRQPLGRMKVAAPVRLDPKGPGTEALLGLLRAELNVRDLEVVSDDSELVRLSAKPDFRVLGARFGKQTPQVAKAVQALRPEQVRQLEAGQPAIIRGSEGDLEIHLNEVQVIREVTSDWIVQSDGPYVVALDPTLTDELRREGLAREVVNRIQRLRKDAGFQVSDRIAIAVTGDKDLMAAIRTHQKFICGETLARELVEGAGNGATDRTEAVTIDGLTLRLAVRRVSGAMPPG
jgi:isoleucyl-tRNA synthetase